jgi:hypothetical protein
MNRIRSGVSAIKGCIISGSVALGLAVTSALPAVAQEIIVTVERVRALDRIDPGGGAADFYAKVTIDGETFRTKRIRRANDIRPYWVFRKRVGPGVKAVKFEIYDKDVLSKDDSIDINRLAGKRHLDFKVDTRRCRVLEFSPNYGCGQTIVRSGVENKRAEVRFRVNVRR